MKKPRETAVRWFKQGQHDLKIARYLLEQSPSDACFMAEQAAQKVLKAFLYFRGSRGQTEHSVVYLAERCSEADSSFSAFVPYGHVLDQYYIPTRYPDALADPALPYETYSISQAKEGIQMTSEILELVKQKLSVT